MCKGESPFLIELLRGFYMRPSLLSERSKKGWSAFILESWPGFCLGMAMCLHLPMQIDAHIPASNTKKSKYGIFRPKIWQFLAQNMAIFGKYFYGVNVDEIFIRILIFVNMRITDINCTFLQPHGQWPFLIWSMDLVPGDR